MSGSNSEDLVIVESTDYAQVVFDDVKEFYNNERPLECLFTLNELLKAGSDDMVGIFKVGFEACTDYVCHMNIEAENVSDCKGKVIFSADKLPKDESEYYQFVYVSQSKQQLRGASVPFQFMKNDDDGELSTMMGCVSVSRSSSAEFIQEEEQDAVVIKYGLGETINEIKTRCEQLSKTNETYEKLVKENEEMIKSLKDEVASIKLRCFRLTMDNEKLNFTLRTKAESLKNLADQIASLTSENSKLQSKFDAVSNENRSLLESLQTRIDQIAQLKGELEQVRNNKSELEKVLNLKESELMQLKKDKEELNRIAIELQRINDQIVGLERQVDARVFELEHIKSDLKRNETIVAEQVAQITVIMNERETLTSVIQKLTQEKGLLATNQESLSQELGMCKDKLMAAEQCKEMLRTQLIITSDELVVAEKTVSTQAGTIKELTEKLAHSELENSSLTDKLNHVKIESDQKLDQINGLYHALRLAHTHLETRLKTCEQRRDTTEKHHEVQKRTIGQLEKENDELKERIRAGAREYTKLFEKHRLLRNQTFNQDMNVYHELSSGENLLQFKRRFCNNDMNNSERASSASQQMPRQSSTQNCTEEEFEGGIQNYHHQQHQHLMSSDSVSQDRSLNSQSARASSNTDIENTLLDALLNPSFMNNTWHNNNNNNNFNSNQLIKHQTPSTTTQQPKSTPINRDETSEKVEQESGCVNKRPTTAQTPNLMNSVTELFQLMPEMIISPLSDETKSTTLKCELCDYIFPTAANHIEVETHYSTQHQGPSCPICMLTFRKGYPQTDYEMHVNSHFNN